MLEETLFRAVVACACEAREVDEDGRFLGGGGARRDEEVEGHFAICGFGLVGEFEEFAAAAGNGGGGFDRHGCGCD